ncbi:MAG: hypothetical protein CL398_01910 [Acidiferrobacteraceae bacterium]|nr:hypothetical protein [Acidiferrobacteraceae bacterium]
MMQRILFIHHSLEFGGAETQLLHTLRHLASQDNVKVHLVVYYPTELTKLRIAELEGVESYIVDKKRGLLGGVKTVLFLRGFIKNKNIDMVVTYLVGANLAGLIAGRWGGAKRIVWGLRVTNISSSTLGLKGRVLEAMMIWCSSFVDLVIANSMASLNQYTDHGLKAKRKIVIPNGIDIDQFDKNDDYRLKARTMFHASSQQIVIGTVSRLVEWKGYEIFLNAAQKLSVLNSNIVFVCIGSGKSKYEKSLIDLQHRIGLDSEKIQWLGNRGDISHLINGFDIFTLMSTSGEGLSNSLLEAMATGVPVVATDVGDSRVAVGDFGTVISAGNSTQLVNAWLNILAELDKAKTRALEGRKHVRKEYCSSDNIQRFCDYLIDHR